MLRGDCNQNSQNNLVGLISEKTTLHVQHTSFVHFFAVVLHDFNVKLPENSLFNVLWRKCYIVSCSLFFAATHFHTLVAASISHFLTAAIKLSCYSSKENSLLPLFFISRSSSLSLCYPR